MFFFLKSCFSESKMKGMAAGRPHNLPNHRSATDWAFQSIHLGSTLGVPREKIHQTLEEKIVIPWGADFLFVCKKSYRCFRKPYETMHFFGGSDKRFSDGKNGRSILFGCHESMQVVSKTMFFGDQLLGYADCDFFGGISGDFFKLHHQDTRGIPMTFRLKRLQKCSMMMWLMCVFFFVSK